MKKYHFFSEWFQIQDVRLGLLLAETFSTLFSRTTACEVNKLAKNKMNCELMLTYDTPTLRQTGSRNLTGPKTLPTIWSTYMKLVTKYQICVINNCWEKCDEKCAYMFNVYKNKLSRQTGSRNLTGLKMLPTIWHTYMKLGTKYQISAIDSCWEKCDEKYLGRTDRRTEVKQYTPLPSGERGYNYPLGFQVKHCYFLRMIEKAKMPTLSSDFPRHFLLFFQNNYMHAKLPDLSEMFWLHGFWRSVVIFRIESKSKMCIILFRAAPNTRWPHLSLYAVCYIDICYMFSTTTACQNTRLTRNVPLLCCYCSESF